MLPVCFQGGIAIGYPEDMGMRQGRRWGISPASPRANTHTHTHTLTRPMHRTTPATDGRASVHKTQQPATELASSTGKIQSGLGDINISAFVFKICIP